LNSRLDTEIQLLYRCELAHKLPAAPIIRQLIEDEARPLPDLIPLRPEWKEFEWPRNNEVNFENYWREKDRKSK